MENKNRNKEDNNKQIVKDDGSTSDIANGESNVFERSGKLQRSPVPNQETTASTSSNKPQGELWPMLTPKGSSSSTQEGLQLGRSNVMEVKKMVNELYDYIKDKSNVHHKIRDLVTRIKSAVMTGEREHNALRLRADNAEKALLEALDKAAFKPQKTPKERSDKRKRETPGEEEEQKKRKEDQEKETDSEWETVEDQKKKKAKQREKKKSEQKKEKTNPRHERNKGDALVVEVKGGTTYAELLQKVRADPELKELGQNVVKTRRTQKGEMLFELRRDPTVKSAAFKTLVEKSLGQEAVVRALSQETVVECKDLDEITTEEELRNVLKSQGNMGDVPMTIRMRKGFGGTQTATIRLPTAAANNLLDKGKVKVGWSVCPLKAIPRVTKEMERCFKCMGFGHQARNCKGPDRSELCWRCGEKGHIAIECKKQPRCLLCKKEDGNDHKTGGFKCPAYKKATASQQ